METSQFGSRADLIDSATTPIPAYAVPKPDVTSATLLCKRARLLTSVEGQSGIGHVLYIPTSEIMSQQFLGRCCGPNAGAVSRDFRPPPAGFGAAVSNR
jgi:hypothetical protein